MTQRTLEIVSPVFLREEELAREGLDRIFPPDRPLALEIGCGIGDFMVELAERSPQTNFLAIDIYNKGCLKTCRRIEVAGLDNVRVMRLEARYLLAGHLPPQRLAAVYVNCPDPWPKKRHRARRLVNADFIRMLLFHLRPGGDFFFATDFADYAGQVAEALAAEPGFDNCLQRPVVTDLPGYPLSKYMRRFLDQGQPIYFLHRRKAADAATDALELPAVTPGFRIGWSRAGNE